MAKVNPFCFSTKYQDDESDLLYYGYRYYNASTGRWLSRDPIGENGGLNLFGFVQNVPILACDPLGQQIRLPGGSVVPDEPLQPTHHPRKPILKGETVWLAPPCLNGTKMKYIQVVSAGKGWDLRNLWDELLTLFGKRPFQGLPLVDNGAAFGSRTLLLQHADPYYSETDPIFGAFGRSQEAFGDRARGFSSLLTFEVCRVCLCN